MHRKLSCCPTLFHIAMKEMLNEHWWEIFQRSPHKQKKPYILHHSFGKERFSYHGMTGHTANMKAYIKSQKSEGSPAYISSHLFGKDLRNYQFNLFEKKGKKKITAAAKKYMTFP